MNGNLQNKKMPENLDIKKKFFCYYLVTGLTILVATIVTIFEFSTVLERNEICTAIYKYKVVGKLFWCIAFSILGFSLLTHRLRINEHKIEEPKIEDDDSKIAEPSKFDFVLLEYLWKNFDSEIYKKHEVKLKEILSNIHKSKKLEALKSEKLEAIKTKKRYQKVYPFFLVALALFSFLLSNNYYHGRISFWLFSALLSFALGHYVDSIANLIDKVSIKVG